MRKTCRLINQFYEEKLTTVGLKVGQFSILRAIFLLGQTTNKDLQKVLILDQTTLTRNLKPLMRDGLLFISGEPSDKRIKVISLSSAGKRLYQQALPLWQAAQKEFKVKVGESDSSEIFRLTKKIVKELS